MVTSEYARKVKEEKLAAVTAELAAFDPQDIQQTISQTLDTNTLVELKNAVKAVVEDFHHSPRKPVNL